ncbi:hypothetical protein [Gramella sp. AN32]|uniref:Allorecognition 2 n=1 Tax=Christiangramia antarctica TaxID=2058158 RepID=A0ABW5X2Y3_9FLAO|nr:hypothetical protein [Gramella sp. AN32]MCM4156823.1 hypothetical protein [Gramella sp. AN32]
MKILSIFFLVLITSGIAQGQNDTIQLVNPLYKANDTIPKIIYSENSQNQFLGVVNGRYVNQEALISINSENIDSINVEIKSFTFQNRKYAAKAILNTISTYTPAFISLKEIQLKFTDIKNEDIVIFSLDGNIINEDANKFLLDEKNIMQIKVTPLDRLNYSKTIFMIQFLLRSPENLKKVNTIRIRGYNKSFE